jgi:rare lipoprotein A
MALSKNGRRIISPSADIEISRACLVPRRLRKNQSSPSLVNGTACARRRCLGSQHHLILREMNAMQKRRAVRNALFLLAACATAQAAALTESSARTSQGTRHDLSSRSSKVHHSGLSGGIASVYSGGGTASGERMNPGALTAAHPSLPFGTKVRVTNSHTGRSVVVRINDRGPFVKGRVIDLSPAAAKAIGVGGIAQVSLSTN